MVFVLAATSSSLAAVALARQFSNLASASLVGFVLITVACGAACFVGGLVAVLALRRINSGRALLLALIGAEMLMVAALKWQLSSGSFGILSVVLFGIPSVALVVLATRTSARRCGAVIVVFLCCLGAAALLGPVQQRIAGEQWLAARGVPARQDVQILALPNFFRFPARWDGKELVVTFGVPAGPGGTDAGVDVVETVRSGSVDPCGPLLYGTGVETVSASPPCSQEAPGLWFRGTADVDPGYVLQRDGVTVTLTGGAGYVSANIDATFNSTMAADFGGRAGLRQIIEAAHPATDRELQPTGLWMPKTLLGWLLL